MKKLLYLKMNLPLCLHWLLQVLLHRDENCSQTANQSDPHLSVPSERPGNRDCMTSANHSDLYMLTKYYFIDFFVSFLNIGRSSLNITLSHLFVSS